MLLKSSYKPLAVLLVILFIWIDFISFFHHHDYKINTCNSKKHYSYKPFDITHITLKKNNRFKQLNVSTECLICSFLSNLNKEFNKTSINSRLIKPLLNISLYQTEKVLSLRLYNSKGRSPPFNFM